MSKIYIFSFLLQFHNLVFSQNLLEDLNTKLKAVYGQSYEISSYLKIDSGFINSSNNIYELITDPFKTLQDLVIFCAIDSSNEYENCSSFIGIYNDKNFIWESPHIIASIDIASTKVFASLDLNNDGIVEVLTTWKKTGRFAPMSLWIFNWNGSNGNFINNIDVNCESLVYTISTAEFRIVDIEGDGIWELEGSEIEEKEGQINDSEEPPNYIFLPLIYKWDGIKYGVIEDFQFPSKDIIYPRNKINVAIKARIIKLGNTFNYQYNVKNLPNSSQEINEFVISRSVDSIFSYTTPSDWLFRNEDKYFYWASKNLNKFLIKKNEEKRFSLFSSGLPRLSKCYFLGNNLNNYHYSPVEELQHNSKISFTVGPTNLLSTTGIIEFIDTLIYITYESFSLNWISTQSAADKYNNLLTTAKTQLQQNNINAVKSTLQTVLTEVDKDSTSNITSEAYALLRYNTEYLLEHLPEPVNTISTYSLFASHSLWLEIGSKVLSGDIGVNNAGSPPFLDSQVELSAGVSTTASGYSVKANRIKVKQNAKINGDIYYNQIENNGTIIGTKNTPLELPLFPPPGEAGSSFPEFKTSTPGMQNIIIEANKEQVLQPGSYGNIDVKMNGRLIFIGGLYNIKTLNAGLNAKLMFQSVSEIRIAGKFDSNEGSYIGPQDTTVLSAKEIKFYVAGINGTAGTLSASPKAAKIGIKNKVKANFYVPNGTLWIMMNSDAEGAFIAKDLSIGVGTKIKLNSAF